MTPERLHAFLRDQLAIHGEKDAEGNTAPTLTRIEIGHLGTRYLPLKSFDVVASTDWATLAELVYGEAREDAGARSGRQRYQARAFHGAIAPAATNVFTIDGGASLDDDRMLTDSEPPTETGMIMQQMRLLERFATLLQHGNKDVMEAQTEIIDRLERRLGGVEERHLKVLATFEDLMTQQHVRDLATEEQKLKIRAWTEGFDKVSLLIPIVINKLAGRRIMPEPASAESQVIGQFLETITEEQLQELTRIFQPEQMLIVAEMVAQRRQQLADAKAAGDQRVKKLQAASDGAKVSGA